MNKKAVLVFDLDNTLILRDNAMIDCIKIHLYKFLSEEQRYAILQQDNHGHSNRIEFCNWLNDFLKLEKSAAEIWKIIKENIANFVILNDDVEVTLTQLEKQYELALLSNGGSRNQRNKIRRVGLERFFKHIFISEEIGYAKPKRKSFFSVQQKLIEHQIFYMIGDHLEKDIYGAKNFGWEAIHYNPSGISRNKNISYIKHLSVLEQLLT